MLGLLAALVLLTATAAAAQTTNRVYRPNPADEDWSFLKDGPRADIWDPAKYIRLGRDNWFMTASGEIRVRPEGFRVRPTDDASWESYVELSCQFNCVWRPAGTLGRCDAGECLAGEGTTVIHATLAGVPRLQSFQAGRAGARILAARASTE